MWYLGNEQAKKIIENYFDTCLCEPEKHWPEYYFRKRCIERFAAKIFMDAISNSEDPLDAMLDCMTGLCLSVEKSINVSTKFEIQTMLEIMEDMFSDIEEVLSDYYDVTEGEE